VHGEGWGAVPDWYADLQGAQHAGVSWPEFETWPLWRKTRVFASMQATSNARDEKKRLNEMGF
jgi:hypothetical protein